MPFTGAALRVQSTDSSISVTGAIYDTGTVTIIVILPGGNVMKGFIVNYFCVAFWLCPQLSQEECNALESTCGVY